ncbi:c-type cytochrome [Hydrogenimonas sp.]
MRAFATAILLSTLFIASAQAQSLDGKGLFEQKCAVCHIPHRPTKEDRAKMVAPPAMGVMYHVKERYTSPEAAVDFVVDYVMDPKREKAVCMERSIRRFGLMPSQKGSVSEPELRAIAAYMVETFPPAGFRHPKMGGGPVAR